MDVSENAAVRNLLGQADAYLVAFDDSFADTTPAFAGWDDVAGAQICLQEAHTALTEADMSDVDNLILESGPLGPSTDLISRDDPRSVWLFTLHERLARLAGNHPPTARTDVTDILGELRSLCAALGFSPPEPKRP